MPDYNYKLIDKGNEWLPIMYAGRRSYITIGFEAPAGWAAEDVKVFEVNSPRRYPAFGNRTAEQIHDDIMTTYLAGLPGSRVVPPDYTAWWNGAYSGSGGYTFVQHHKSGNEIVIRDRRNRGGAIPAGGSAEFEFIVRFTSVGGEDILVDPGIRNEY